METNIIRTSLDKDYKTNDAVIGEVFMTSDYSKFTTFSGNRHPDHVAQLIKSFVENGAIDVPVKVTCGADEKLVVVDGWNSFNARRELGLPIPYIILKEANEKTMGVLNQVQKNWTKKDFIHFYATCGIPEYITFESIIEEYPNFPVQSLEFILALSLGQHSSNRDMNISAYRRLERGKFIIPDVMQSRYILDSLLAIKKVERNDTPVYNHAVFIAAILRLYKVENFSFTDLISAIKKYPSKFYRQLTAKDYGRMIEDIINYNKKKDKVRFDVRWEK